MNRRSCNRDWQAGLVCLGMALAMVGCKDKSSSRCVHPCDLAQCFWVEVSGAVPAAEILVSDACGGGGKCPASGCRSVLLCLARQVGPADLTCHVTAVSANGDVVERDMVASMTRGSCCGGYEFPQNEITVSFPYHEDGGVDGDADDGSAGEDRSEPAETGL
jgi:hypothetical protein